MAVPLVQAYGYATATGLSIQAAKYPTVVNGGFVKAGEISAGPEAVWVTDHIVYARFQVAGTGNKIVAAFLPGGTVWQEFNANGDVVSEGQANTRLAYGPVDIAEPA